jgi:hypothetical protein
LTAKTNENESVDLRWQSLYSRKLEVEAIEAFRFFRERNIEPILIKGWAAARNYPALVLRFYSDIDLAVAADDYERSNQVLRSDDGRHVAVDLHRELRHLDTKPWDAIFRDSELVELDGQFLRIPCAEDHLRIMAVHWLNDGGAPKERLWDIYYAVANRPESFDWDVCLGPASERRGWVVAAIGLAHRYLDLCIDDLPFKDEARALPEWLTKTVEAEWRSGVPLRPLHLCLRDPAELVRQILKRVPPNALQATIEMEGDIVRGSRLWYQLGCTKKRAMPSIRRLTEAIGSRLRT